MSSTATGTCVACGGSLREGPAQFAGKQAADARTIQICTDCGTGHIVPWPDAATVAATYSQEYFQAYLEGPGVKGGNRVLAPHLEDRLAQLEHVLGPRRRLVDVGCAYGLFVAAARDRGWQAEGVDPSAWAAGEGFRRFGITIHPTDLEHAPIEPGSVDAVHANHVLEHLVDPAATLAAAARLLKPDGVLVVEVPQEVRRPLSDRLYGSLHPRLYPRRVLDRTHLAFFSAAGLKAAVQRAGLVDLRVRTVRHAPNLASRLPLGSTVKLGLVRLEELSGSAPDLVLWARRGS